VLLEVMLLITVIPPLYVPSFYVPLDELVLVLVEVVDVEDVFDDD